MKKIMTLAAIFAAVMMGISSCNPDDTKPEQKPDTEQPGDETPGEGEGEQTPGEGEGEQTPGEGEGEEEYASPITIDGDFADWDALDAAKVAVATTDPDAAKAGLKTVKVYADGVFINVYFEFDPDIVSDLTSVPFHVYFNSDNSSNDPTSEDQWTNSGDIDYMCEGWVFSEGAFCPYDPSLNAAGYTPDAYDWAWVDVLPDGSSISTGAGKDTKYEFAFTLEMMDAIEFADTFGIGFDIQQSWNSVGILPNAAQTETNLSGTAPLLLVTFDK